MDTLISNVTVVTMNPAMDVLFGAYLGIEAGKICSISQTPPETPPATIIDGTGMVAMPGMINCHTHLATTVLRNLLDDESRAGALQAQLYKEDKMDNRTAKAAALLGIAECLRFGVTSVSDLYYFPNATAEAAAQNLRELGIPEEKISVIINGSLPVREVDEATLAKTRKRFGIKKDDFTVGICARLEECKGHDTFLAAAAILLQQSPQIPFRFLIVGEGSRRQELEKLATDLGIADYVTFTGFISDMAPIYHILHLNVNCSSGTETSCLAISEGMSVGLPTVASDYGGNMAMIGESGAGFLFPVGDAKALADAILKIAEDRELEERMKVCARERYLSHFTAEKMSREVQEVYEKMLK